MLIDSRFGRFAIASFGALVLSSMTIATAADPARAGTPQAGSVGAAQVKAPARV